MNRTAQNLFSTSALIALMAGGAHAGDVNWVGGTSADVTDATNWDTASVPAPGVDIARFAGATNPDLLGNSVTWGSMWLGTGDTTIAATGGGTINLDAAINGNGSSFWAVGDPTNSVIDANIVAAGNIVANNDHNVAFNGSVTTNRTRVFNNSSITYNGAYTQTEQFFTMHPGATVVLNGPTDWNFPGEAGLHVGGTLELGPNFSTTGPEAIWGVLNMFDQTTLRLGADDRIGQDIDLWGRTNASTLDLNGFSENNIEFIGTNAGQQFNIDFGDTPGANTLSWAASWNANGTYNITNFETDVDTLLLGPFGTGGGFDPDAGGLVNLAKLTINGLAYEQDLGDGVSWTVEDADGGFHRVVFSGTLVPGDTDGDGDIDDSDLGTAFSNYTGPLPPGTGGKTAADGDTDGDGDVDDSDLGTAFAGYTGPLGPASVPEPTSLALLGLGGLVIARRRRA
ncbi:MAG: PEP-CTERM sorting domain-containing protein [Phycisphaeraceae bacterium]